MFDLQFQIIRYLLSLLSRSYERENENKEPCCMRFIALFGRFWFQRQTPYGTVHNQSRQQIINTINTTTVNKDKRNTQNMTNLLHSLTDTLLQDYIRRLVPSYDSVL